MLKKIVITLMLAISIAISISSIYAVKYVKVTFATENDCYKYGLTPNLKKDDEGKLPFKPSQITRDDGTSGGQRISPTGIVVSSCKSGSTSDEIFKLWNTSIIEKKEKGLNKEVCFHFLVDDKDIRELLPLTMKSWACRQVNSTHISILIGEPENLNDKKFFNDIWNNTTELCVAICRMLNINTDNIVGINKVGKFEAPEHWFKLHNKSMLDLKKNVDNILTSNSSLEWEIELEDKNDKEYCSQRIKK